MTRTSDSGLLALVEEIQRQTASLVQHLKAHSVAEPSLTVGSSTELWKSNSQEINTAKSSILGLTKQLSKIVYGPEGFLHEFVSQNWDFGAFYTILEFDILEKIPLNGESHISQLVEQSGIPEDKLLRILRLASCDQILEEASDGVFRHTAISEALVTDKRFKAFIGFQYVSSKWMAKRAMLKAQLCKTLRDTCCKCTFGRFLKGERQ